MAQDFLDHPEIYEQLMTWSDSSDEPSPIDSDGWVDHDTNKPGVDDSDNCAVNHTDVIRADVVISSIHIVVLVVTPKSVSIYNIKSVFLNQVLFI